MFNSRPFLDNLVARGTITFTTKQFARSLGLSVIAATHSLVRLRKQKLIASPFRGFHVILEPADRARGFRSPDEFIDYLMRHLNEPYYIGLLSAAEINGAAHQRPQIYQVMVKKERRPVKCGSVRIQFIRKANLAKIPTSKQKVRTGYILVSTPEATAFDLVAYDSKAGGLDNVTTLLYELAPNLSGKKLLKCARHFEIPVCQRLGLILDELKQDKLASVLQPEIKKRAVRLTALLPGKATKGAPINKKWRVIVNERLEPEL